MLPDGGGWNEVRPRVFFFSSANNAELKWSSSFLLIWPQVSGFAPPCVLL
jgi:hypothetical protein